MGTRRRPVPRHCRPAAARRPQRGRRCRDTVVQARARRHYSEGVTSAGATNILAVAASASCLRASDQRRWWRGLVRRCSRGGQVQEQYGRRRWPRRCCRVRWCRRRRRQARHPDGPEPAAQQVITRERSKWREGAADTVCRRR